MAYDNLASGYRNKTSARVFLSFTSILFSLLELQDNLCTVIESDHKVNDISHRKRGRSESPIPLSFFGVHHHH
jgi:hypothetical protein